MPLILKDFLKRCSKSDFTILFLFILIIGVSIAPFLFGERFIFSSDSDALFYYYPAFSFYGEALQSGQSFLWNPLLFSGFPMYLSQSAGFFDPVNYVLFKFLPFIYGYNFRFALDIFLVVIFSYFAGRVLGISRPASVLIGFSWLLAFNWRFLTNLLISNSLFLLPFLIFIFTKLIENHRRRLFWSSIAGLGIGWAFLSGNAQFNVYSITLVFLYAIMYYFLVYCGQKSVKDFLFLFLYLILAVIIGFAVGSPQILPALKFTPLTVREGGLDYASALDKVLNFRDFILFLLPDFLYFPYISAGRKPLYIGALLFLLAFISIFYIFNSDGSDKKRKRIISTFLILFSFAFLTSFKWSPIFYLLHKLPVFEFFRYPYRWMYLGSWFLVILGALSLDLIRSFDINKYLKNFYITIFSFVGVFDIFIIALNFFSRSFWLKIAAVTNSLFSGFLYGRFGFVKDLSHYKEAIIYGIDAWREFVSLFSVEFAIPFLILNIAVILMVIYLFKRLSADRFIITSMVFSILTFISIFILQWPGAIPAGQAVNLQKGFFYKYISANDRLNYRFLPFMVEYGFSKAVPPQFKLSFKEESALTNFQFASGLQNMNFYSGVSSIDGYDPFVPKNLLNALADIGSVYSAGDLTRNLSETQKTERLIKNLDVIGMMAGKYIISGIELNSGSLKLLGKESVTEYNAPIFVYENLKAGPKFYLAGNVVSAPGRSLAELIGDANRDFSRYAYLDCVDCGGADLPAGAVDVLSYKNGYINLGVNADADAWLIISESFLPGWAADIDGRPVTIIRANGLYMAVKVPAGFHKITLEYNGIMDELKILRNLHIIK